MCESAHGSLDTTQDDGYIGLSRYEIESLLPLVHGTTSSFRRDANAKEFIPVHWLRNLVGQRRVMTSVRWYSSESTEQISHWEEKPFLLHQKTRPMIVESIVAQQSINKIPIGREERDRLRICVADPSDAVRTTPSHAVSYDRLSFSNSWYIVLIMMIIFT